MSFNSLLCTTVSIWRSSTSAINEWGEVILDAEAKVADTKMRIQPARATDLAVELQGKTTRITDKMFVKAAENITLGDTVKVTGTDRTYEIVILGRQYSSSVLHHYEIFGIRKDLI